MRQIIEDSWFTFTEPFEGRVYHMYLDILGYVTTGDGNLIDSPGAAKQLPWKHADGSLASPAEVEAAWHAVKDRIGKRKGTGKLETDCGGVYFSRFTTLRLTSEDVDHLVIAKLHEMDMYLTRRFGSSWSCAPADAQMAVMSMSWAMGPAFHYPKFEAAFRRGDYVTCASECKINPNVGTIVLRNDANKALLLRAAQAQDPDVLHYP